MSEINGFPKAEEYYYQPLNDPMDPSTPVNIEEATCTCGCKPSTQ